MLRDMPASEFRRWKILEGVEPFGVYSDWLRTGLVLSLIANIHRKPGTFAHTAEEFMPETMRASKVGPTHAPEHIYRVMMMLKQHQDLYLARRKEAIMMKRSPNAGDDTGTQPV